MSVTSPPRPRTGHRAGGVTQVGVVAAGTSTLPATMALTALTLVTGLGMARLFDGRSFVLPVVATALTMHGLAYAGRLRRVALTVVLAGGAAALFVLIAWLVLPHTTAFGLPLRGTLHAFTTEMSSASEAFSRVVAPAPATKGFVMASMIGVAMVAMLGDWAAFRTGSTFEGVVPAFGLFIFTSVLGNDRGRWPAVAAELTGMLVFLAIHSAQLQVSTTPWFASRQRGGSRALLRGAAVIGLVAVAAAVILGPRIPGADDEPLFGWRSEQEATNSRRTTISPLVDIRGRLTDRSNSEAFRVASNGRAYWRLTALDTFDGTIWSSNDSYRKAGGELPIGDGGRAPGPATLVQDFTITDLASIWLPSAYRPARLTGVKGASYNADSGSLISREATSDGLQYHVVSEVPMLTAGALSTAPDLPDRSLRHHLDLPAISPRVVQLANQIVGGAATPYERARRIQDHLRNNYAYDLGIDQGHDNRALENFLFTTRRGYCEQFAGAYAVLARLVGLPSRVAVGFTPGEPDAEGRFVVRGLNAHAWPEVHLEGFGWVQFEPTPGRGAPNTQPYTGVAEQQASAQAPNVATTLVPTPTTAAPDAGGQGQSTTTVPAEATGGAGTPPKKANRFVTLAIGVGTVLFVLLLIWVVAVPLTRRARRSRRRRAAVTPASRVLVAWAEADESLSLARSRRRTTETLAEHAARAASTLDADGGSAMVELAGHAAAASYAPEINAELADRAFADAAVVEAAAAARATRLQRVKRELSLRG
ncbi:MAG TPA: DUF3488 and transglutaminase-like domain-containing protein [Acidimicrobiales bacterium]|nr:DUF3488 and transglutaminase-like domain-containing protein [Acidimicrobiales bacterium]